MKTFFLFFALTSLVQATENDRLHLPKAFASKGSKAVFADFNEATYTITYDLSARKVSARAEIKLETFEPGYPIFDSVSEPTLVELDGVATSANETKTPNGETTVRVVNKLTQPGTHELVVEVPITELVDYFDTGVKSAFWTSDLDDREYLEHYLPANFEFDQVKMNFLINFIGAKNKQIIYTNGDVTEIDSNHFKIIYPDYYTASSIFFHTVPAGTTLEKRFTLTSVDGRTIPAVVYVNKTSTASLDKLKEKTIAVFNELEKDYGAFPHPSITVLQSGMGGMEYCGATMTDFSALGHELFHSYFARGVMPANGNAGWLDEALASWRDDGYLTSSSLSGTSGMSSHLYYTRSTDTAAYSFGKRFMQYLDGKTQSQGGLKPFLKHMIETKLFSPLFVEEFIAEMSNFYHLPLEKEFKKYTFGTNDFSILEEKAPTRHKLSIKELKAYL